MALVLTKFQAYGIDRSEPLGKKRIQCLRIVGTGATSDITHDYGSFAGTFWAACDDTATGARALKALKDISARAESLLLVGGSNLSKVRGAAATTGVYSQAFDGTNTKIPSITFNTAEGPTAWDVTLMWTLKDGEMPVQDEASA